MAFNIQQIMGLLQNSGNPMQLLQQFAANNPEMQRALQMAQGGDPKQVFMNLAKERGMTQEQIQAMASQAGITV